MDSVSLRNSVYNSQTIWPENFDPDTAGAINIKD
jgi:hypothetical protein